MNSKRLECIANLVPQGATVLDIGTDHAYLPIYLIKNKICNKVLASDISQKSLEKAKDNLNKYAIYNVELFLSDGLEKINGFYDVITISGMGASTIIKILQNKKLPNTLILSSNNDLAKLRKFMNKNNYTIQDEVIITENNKYYDIIKYQKGKEYLSYYKLKYGKSNDKKYYKYLLEKERYKFYRIKFISKLTLLKDIIYLFIKTI